MRKRTEQVKSLVCAKPPVIGAHQVGIWLILINMIISEIISEIRFTGQVEGA